MIQMKLIQIKSKSDLKIPLKFQTFLYHII